MLRGSPVAQDCRAMAAGVIVSYDGTTNDDDALALARMLAAGGATLALAYVRHSREYDPRREEIAEHDARRRLEHGATWLGPARHPRPRGHRPVHGRRAWPSWPPPRAPRWSCSARTTAPRPDEWSRAAPPSRCWRAAGCRSPWPSPACATDARRRDREDRRVGGRRRMTRPSRRRRRWRRRSAPRWWGLEDRSADLIVVGSQADRAAGADRPQRRHPRPAGLRAQLGDRAAPQHRDRVLAPRSA